LRAGEDAPATELEVEVADQERLGRIPATGRLRDGPVPLVDPLAEEPFEVLEVVGGLLLGRLIGEVVDARLEPSTVPADVEGVITAGFRGLVARADRGVPLLQGDVRAQEPDAVRRDLNPEIG